MPRKTASSRQLGDGFARKSRLDIRNLRSRMHGDSVLNITSPASSEAKCGRPFTLDYEDSIDNQTVDTVDEIWSGLAKRRETSSASNERTYPIIRAIRERASRGYVHDEVQLNDDRIISQIYSSYIKKTKALLNNYIDPRLEEFFHRKSWFLDAGNETKSTGQEFAKFLLAKKKHRRNLVDANRIGKEPAALSPELQSDENLRSVRSRNVSFKDVIDSKRGSEVDPAEGNSTVMKDQCDKIGDDQIMSSSSPLTVKDNDFVTCQKAKPSTDLKSRNALLFTKSSGSRFLQGEENSRKCMLSIRGILKKESNDGRLFITTRRTADRPSAVRTKNEIAGDEVERRRGLPSEEKGKVIKSSRSNEDRQGVTGTTTPNSNNTWNRGMRLLRGVSAVSILAGGGKKQNISRKRPGNSSHLGIPNERLPLRRKSITPDISSQASSSPIWWHRNGEIRGKTGTSQGTWRGQKRLGNLDKGQKRGDSQGKLAMETQQYNDLGVGKIAEVTTVSSFVRYEFDIPDDLDDNLEHLRLHGYLRE